MWSCAVRLCAGMRSGWHPNASVLPMLPRNVRGALQHRSLCCVIAGAVPPGTAAKRDRVMQVGAPGSAVGYVASPALPGQKLAWQDYPSQLQTEPQLLSLDRPVSAQLPIPPSVPPGFACTVLAGDGFPSPLLERG